jgi:phytoene synthase
MQLTNIARDVGEDARQGRLYLPLQWLHSAGIDPDRWLARPVFCEALGTVVRRLLVAADGLYERSTAGIAGLPLACRPGIYAARSLYAEIGREIERRGCDSISSRAVVSSSRKAILLARSIAALATTNRSRDVAPLAEAQYLVDAVAAGPLPRPPHGETRNSGIVAPEGRVVWLIDLFEQLERRGQLRGSNP